MLREKITFLVKLKNRHWKEDEKKKEKQKAKETKT